MKILIILMAILATTGCDRVTNTSVIFHNNTVDSIELYLKFSGINPSFSDTLFFMESKESVLWEIYERRGKERFYDLEFLLEAYDSISAVKDEKTSENLMNESQWKFTKNNKFSGEHILSIDDSDF